MIIGLTFICIVAMVLLVRMASRPDIILYALAAVVSLVGLNIHLGVTFYLSRIVLIIFILALFVRSALGKSGGFQFHNEPTFIKLFALILSIQLISVLLSTHIMDGL